MSEDIKCVIYGLLGSVGLYFWLYTLCAMPGH